MLTFDAAGSAIVLAGSFNPSIFQPEWFAKQGLLPEGAAKKAEIKIITPQVCQFETDEFLLQVMDQRFIVQSKLSADPAPLSDLVSGTFFILEHTPVIAMGLNRSMHVDLKSEDAWHQLGDRLVPKDGWKSVLEGRPGMVGVAVNSPMKDFPNAMFTMRIEPSLRLKHGAYFDTNENYPALPDEPEPLMYPRAMNGNRHLGQLRKKARIISTRAFVRTDCALWYFLLRPIGGQHSL